MRAVAASWVFGFHLVGDVDALFGTDSALARANHVVFDHGYLGVELFFLLSGFVLALNYADRFRTTLELPAWRSFLRKRLARVYPNHLVTLAWMALLISTVPAATRATIFATSTRETLLQHLLLVTTWTGSQTLSWNEPAWSISSEWLAYLCFPGVGGRDALPHHDRVSGAPRVGRRVLPHHRRGTAHLRWGAGHASAPAHPDPALRSGDRVGSSLPPRLVGAPCAGMS